MQPEKLILTEKELIELTMEYGYNGSELINPHFLEKGFLKKNGVYDSFIKKVESICESWERLKKKKGNPVIYEISNLYDHAVQIPDKRIYNGKKPTPEDLIMKDYIHFCLGLSEINNDRAYSLNRWGELFELTSKRDLEKMEQTKIFEETYWKREVEKVVSTFKTTIIKRNKDVVSNAFKLLEKQKKIRKYEIPMFIHLDETVSSISRKKYDEVDLAMDKILASNNITRNDYYYNHFKKGVIKAKKEVKSMLEEKGIKKYFIGYKIKVLEPLPQEEWVSVYEYLKAYADRLIQLTLLRENNPAYQVDFVEKKFYIFNTLCLMRELDYEVDEELIEKYKPSEEEIEVVHNSKIEYKRIKEEQLKLQYAFTNRIKDESLKTWGFKTIYL